MQIIKDRGWEEPAVQAESGSKGKQSPTNYRFDLIDAEAILALAENLHRGAEKYGVDNWKHISSQNHLNKGLIHIYAHLAGDTQDDHLVHAFTRMMMAIAVARDGVIE